MGRVIHAVTLCVSHDMNSAEKSIFDHKDQSQEKAHDGQITRFESGL